MTLAAAQTELAAVNAAILTILAGGVASYGINGRTVSKLDLKTLYDRQSSLDNLIARLQYGMVSVAAFRDPE